MAYFKCSGGSNPTGNATEGDVLATKTFSNADGTDKVGTMPNRGAVSISLNASTTSYTIPVGYHNGSGTVSITTQTKTVTSSRSAQTVTPDSGKLLSSVTVNALVPTGTYTATSRGSALDMGATSNYRYVNTNSVPNTNSGTYTFASGDTGGTKDLGATNTYRYVNAANVYNQGKADGKSGISTDLANHTLFVVSGLSQQVTSSYGNSIGVYSFSSRYVKSVKYKIELKNPSSANPGTITVALQGFTASAGSSVTGDISLPTIYASDSTYVKEGELTYASGEKKGFNNIRIKNSSGYVSETGVIHYLIIEFY